MIWFFFLSSAFAKNSPAVFPLGSTKDGELYVTFNDINQMKIMFLTFAVYALVNLIKWIVGIFTKTEQKTREAMHAKLQALEEDNKQILNAIQKLEIHLAHIKDDQVTADEVRTIARNELEYVSKVRSKRE